MTRPKKTKDAPKVKAPNPSTPDSQVCRNHLDDVLAWYDEYYIEKNMTADQCSLEFREWSKEVMGREIPWSIARQVAQATGKVKLKRPWRRPDTVPGSKSKYKATAAATVRGAGMAAEFMIDAVINLLSDASETAQDRAAAARLLLATEALEDTDTPDPVDRARMARLILKKVVEVGEE